MPDTTSGTFEVLSGTLTLGKKSVRPVAWLLLVAAALDYEARWLFMSLAALKGDYTNPSVVMMILVAVLLLLLDLSVLTTVGLLLFPLQDGILRGRSIGVKGAVQTISGKIGQLTISSVAQTVIVFALPFLFYYVHVGRSVANVPLVEGVPNIYKMQEVARVSAVQALWPSLVWMGALLILLMFALPYVILESRGPLRSLGLSARLVIRGYREEPSRFWTLCGVWIGIAAVIIAPEILIGLTRTVTLRDHIVLQFFLWAWRSLSASFPIPWICASVMVMFRHLVPARA